MKRKLWLLLFWALILAPVFVDLAFAEHPAHPSGSISTPWKAKDYAQVFSLFGAAFAGWAAWAQLKLSGIATCFRKLDDLKKRNEKDWKEFTERYHEHRLQLAEKYATRSELKEYFNKLDGDIQSLRTENNAGIADLRQLMETIRAGVEKRS